MHDLFSPVTIGKWSLPNRIAMAPMTRSRADSFGVPGHVVATYYRQRATAGLIITEGVQPGPAGQGYTNTPGLHTVQQVAGWHAVADAVHEEGGHIVAQLMHAGRISHPDNKNGHETVAPSALTAPGEIFTAGGMRPYPAPRALTTAEIPSVVEEYVNSARSAVAAGLDGIELHGANGYLIHQFLTPSTNHRTDAYGGSTAARARFATEVVEAVADAIGSERVGLRISPGANLHGAIEDNPAETAETYGMLIDKIAPLDLAYLHTIGDSTGPLITDLRARFQGPLIVSDGWYPMTDAAAARRYVESGAADLVAVGRAFIANPDLVRRWQTGASLNEPDPTTFYGGDTHGYTDYPLLTD
ncbi:alkene reductase [Streptomyces sp. NPDC001880]